MARRRLSTGIQSDSVDPALALTEIPVPVKPGSVASLWKDENGTYSLISTVDRHNRDLEVAFLIGRKHRWLGTQECLLDRSAVLSASYAECL